MSSDRVCVGAIAGAFGAQGEVRLKSFCAEPRAIADYAPLWTEDGRRFDPVLGRAIKSGFAARLSGVENREQAESLKGERLYAARDRLPDTAEDEFYHADLVGMTVLDTGGAEVGQVAAVLNHGASDLLEIAGPGLKTPALLPFTREAVPVVDVPGGRIVADPPAGIFPDIEKD